VLLAALFLAAAARAQSGPAGTWAPLDYPRPGLLQSAGLALDSTHRCAYLVGGYRDGLVSSETWRLDFSDTLAWSRLVPAGVPPEPRQQHSLVVDPVGRRLLLFGGLSEDGRTLGDLWSLPLEGTLAWTRLSPSGPAPPPRHGHSATFDPVRDRMIVAGGMGADSALADAWALSLAGTPAWAPLTPVTAGPGRRDAPAVAFDDAQRLMWTYGGRDAHGAALADCWVFGPGDTVGWRPVTPGGDVPDALSGATLVHDPGRARLLLFGGTGTDAGSYSDRVWAIATADGAATLLAPSGTPPSPRWGHASVFDPVGDRMIVIGGWDGHAQADVFQLSGDGAAWTALAPTGTGPAGLAYHTAVLDSAHNRVIVWGGTDGHQFLAQAWALDLTDPPTWSQIAVTGDAPAARTGHVAAFDADAQRMLISGGTPDWAGALDDTWVLDLQAEPVWRLVSAGAGAPSHRGGGGSWDQAGARLLVFAGVASGTTAPNADVWALATADTFRWDRLWPVAGQPPRRTLHATVYDPLDDALVMFGGRGGAADTTHLDDVWTIGLAAGSAWSQVLPLGAAPAARDGHSATWDAAGARVLVFGGDAGAARLDDLWALTLGETPAWELLAPAGGPPPPRFLHGAVMDATGSRLIVTGGAGAPDSARGDTWALDLSGSPAWTELSPASCRPPQQLMPTVTYDPVGRRMIVIGDTWDAAQRVWQMPLTGRPEWAPLAATGTQIPPRWGHSAVYDPSRRRIVVFGGNFWNGSTTMDDTWALDLDPAPHWSQLFPAGTPPAPRMGHAAVYDPVRDRMIVHGGYAKAGDIYALHGQYALQFGDTLRWAPLETADSSALDRNFHSATYDPVRDRVLVFGGCEFDTYGSVWELTLGDTVRWRELVPEGSGPANRRSHSTVYDPVRDRLIVYGGDTQRFWGTGSVLLDDVWALQLADSVHWEPVTMDGPPAGVRCEHQALWDAAFGRMIVFGGNSVAESSELNDDTWQAVWDGAHPVAVGLAAASVEADGVHLTWACAGLAGPATVERRDGDGPWHALGGVLPDAAGRVSWCDVTVEPGRSYGYRLALGSGSGSTAGGEVWVVVPQAVRLAVRSIRPNPTLGLATVTLSLPTPAPATLDAYDLAGRRVLHQALGAGSPGARVVELDTRGRLRPGLYLLRLEQAGHGVHARMVVLR
jgi:hypothetical protein